MLFAATSRQRIPSKVHPNAAISRPRHNKWLVLIAAYKFTQALLIAAIGLGAMRLLHKDIDDVLTQLVHALRFNPESRFIDFIADKASLLNDPLLRRIGAVAFSYAGLSLAEGIGLYLEKAWGEILTLAITASFLALGSLRSLPPPHLGPRCSAHRQHPGIYLSLEGRRHPQKAP